MARVKGSVQTRAHRKKILKQAEGYFGSKHLLFKTAKEQVLHSLRYSYVSRREIKRDFRKLWIKRINAACHENGISYSKFMDGLNKGGIKVNRKMLSEMAIQDPGAFKNLVEQARNAEKKAAKPAAK
jgi:large subunit ribosomal protein L20